MTSILDKEQLTENDILKLIELHVEESIHLDFKRAESLDFLEKKKSEIAKDVSAFANSDGGFIVYGIKEENHVAESVSFIDGSQYTKEWLEQIIQTRISRKIPGLRIYPIRFENDIKKSVYVVKIPISSMSPHLSDKRYYKRYNFESVYMEEYEIRELYNKTGKTELKVSEIIISDNGINSQGGMPNEANYKLNFQICNYSNSIEQLFKLEIYIPLLVIKPVSTNSFLSEFLIRHEEGFNIYSVPNSFPLFQNETSSIFSISISLNRHSFRALGKVILKTNLYFTSGMKQQSFDITKRLKFEDKPLSEYWKS